MKKVLFALIGFLFVFGIVFVGGADSATAKKDDVKLKVFIHYPKDYGKPVRSSGCTVTANDQINDYGYAGWQMPTGGMDYKINYTTKPGNLSAAGIQNAVDLGFSAWSSADSNQIFNYTGTTSATGAKYDGTNAVLWGRVSGSAIAVTYVWYYTASEQLVEADTVFNKKLKWSVSNSTLGDCGGIATSYDVQNIGTHEFGHWVGLDDLYNSADKDLTMYGYGTTGELKKDSLGLGDISGVNAIAP